uniref:Thyroglobulin type-1 domain-containing protein n=1 Tax=Oryzias melastigma TaxID=30732 RepID=A0A3B3BBI9_ORYME
LVYIVASGRPKSQCELHRDSLQDREGVGIGSHIPQCDSDGRYRQLQCHGSTGYCWCVDSSGQERQGTRTPPGTTPTDCNRAEQPKTECEYNRDRAQSSGSDGLPDPGLYVPQCNTEGQYVPLQCLGSTGYCWCVDPRGQEIPGTRTSPDTPPTDCDKPCKAAIFPPLFYNSHVCS